MAVNDKLTEQVKQLSARVAQFEGEVVKDNKAVGDLKVKLKIAEKRAENVAYEKNSL